LFLSSTGVTDTYTLSLHDALPISVQDKKQAKRLPIRHDGSHAICPSCDPPSGLSSSDTITGKDEPGEPMEMSGTIYRPDGVTPAEGIVLFVYHTDVTGYYNEQDDVTNPRLRAWMRTGKDGRY